jgi:glycerate kinase
MIMDAIARGCRQFLVGIGGSATNDAGTGMLQAMGFRFYDSDGQVIDHCSGGRLSDIARIDDSQVPAEVRQSVFTVACDVDTPFCGPDGAAPVFAPQKGADTDMVRRLDAGMASLAQVVQEKYGVDVVPVAGAGAAGGMGGAFYAFLQATLKKGIDMVLDAIAFDATIQGAELVITGEGKVDFQTAKGKTAAGVLARACKQHIPVIAIGGCVEMCDSLEQMGFAGIYPILEEKVPLELAMQRDFAMNNVTNTMIRVLGQHVKV